MSGCHHFFKVQDTRTQSEDGITQPPMASFEQAIQSMYGVVGLARAEPHLLHQADGCLYVSVVVESADMVKRALSVENFTFTDSPLLVHL